MMSLFALSRWKRVAAGSALGCSLLSIACGHDTDEDLLGSTPGAGGSAGGSVERALTPGPSGVRKLSGRQYVNSVRLLLGDAAGDVARDLVSMADPPLDAKLSGYEAVGAAQLSF